MQQALLLNASYEPLKVVHWQKAITLWCQGKVEVIAVHDREVRAVSFSFKLPSVIRLLRFVKIKRRFDYVPFSRANIYARDHHTCQYCSHVFPTAELTFDHVLPVAQGGRKDENSEGKEAAWGCHGEMNQGWRFEGRKTSVHRGAECNPAR